MLKPSVMPVMELLDDEARKASMVTLDERVLADYDIACEQVCGLRRDHVVSWSGQGPRPTMEDTHVAVLHVNDLFDLTVNSSEMLRAITQHSSTGTA